MLTPDQERDYLSAAVALDSHERLSDEDGKQFTSPWAIIAWKAWDICNKKIGKGSINDVDIRAARLLRECIKKGEPLS